MAANAGSIPTAEATGAQIEEFVHKALGDVGSAPVSYTHLTLPTICSV